MIPYYEKMGKLPEEKKQKNPKKWSHLVPFYLSLCFNAGNNVFQLHLRTAVPDA